MIFNGVVTTAKELVARLATPTTDREVLEKLILSVRGYLSDVDPDECDVTGLLKDLEYAEAFVGLGIADIMRLERTP